MSETNQPEYPEHEKLRAISVISNHQGQFLDWLSDEGYVLARHDPDGDLYPAAVGIEKLLAAYHDIDLDKIESEKLAMLDAMRSARLQSDETTVD